MGGHGCLFPLIYKEAGVSERSQEADLLHQYKHQAAHPTQMSPSEVTHSSFSMAGPLLQP